MICAYGCGQEAKFKMKNGKMCCSKTYKSCPGIHKKIRSSCKNFWKENPEAKEKQSKLKKNQYEENPEILNNISKTVKNYYKENPEARDAISKFHKERYKNPDERKKNSERQKIYNKEHPEKGQNHSTIMKNCWNDIEKRKKQSKLIKKYFEENPEAVKRLSEIRKKWLQNPDNIKKLSEAQKKRRREEDPKIRKEFGKKMKQFWKENPHKHANYIMAQRGFISLIEKKVKHFLDEEQILYEHNYSQIGYFIDFVIPYKKIAIECDGIYWHNKIGAKEHDKKRQKKLENIGWKFIRFSDYQINKNFEYVKTILMQRIWG